MHTLEHQQKQQKQQKQQPQHTVIPTPTQHTQSHTDTMAHQTPSANPATFGADLARMQQLEAEGVVFEAPQAGSTHTGFAITRCMWAGHTRAGADVVLAESPTYGTLLMLDGELQCSEYDRDQYHEALVHPLMHALAGVPKKRVLIVGGGEGATARELLRYGSDAVASVLWVDIDPDLVHLCRRHLAWAGDEVYNDPRLTYLAADCALVLQDATQPPFDAIVIDLPDPAGEDDAAGVAAQGYLYSAAFWQDVKGRLAPGGGVVSHAGPVEPGVHAQSRRAGLHRLQRSMDAAGLGSGHAYHSLIPSFQGEWAWLMNLPPAVGTTNAVPDLAVFDADWQAEAFHWHRSWFTLGGGL